MGQLMTCVAQKNYSISVLAKLGLPIKLTMLILVSLNALKQYKARQSYLPSVTDCNQETSIKSFTKYGI